MMPRRLNEPATSHLKNTFVLERGGTLNCVPPPSIVVADRIPHRRRRQSAA